MKMARIQAIVLCCFILSITSAISFASQDAILGPTEISQTIKDAGAFGEVKITIRAEGRRIHTISLIMGGNPVMVPPKAYEDLQNPLLWTLQLLVDSGYTKEPWLYIDFKLMSKTTDGNWIEKKVRIAYNDGRIVSRLIGTPKSEGRYEWKEEKM